MKERILFSDNESVANMHIENVMQRYVNHVAEIAVTITNFGVGKVTRALLFDAIYKGGEKVHNAILGKANIPDDETLAEIVTDGIAEKMATIAMMAEKITNTRDVIYNGIPVNNPILFDWIAIDENGIVTLDEKRLAIIRDECRIYITTEIGIRLYNLQKTIVESTQEIHNELHRIMNDANTTLDNTAQFVYFHPGALYHMHHDEEGRTIFTPRQINFDPIPNPESNGISD